MPIINKGIFDTDVVFQRQIGTDWPTVNTNIDLYVENLIAANNLVANGLIIRNVNVSDDVLAGNVLANLLLSELLLTGIIEANSLYARDFITTDGYVVANGLIIRNVEVSDDVITGNILSQISFTDSLSANIITTNAIIASEYVNLNTANVPESSGNLYFTVGRGRSVFTAGEGIVITSNGLIKSKLEDAGKGLFNSGVTFADFKISENQFSNVSSFSSIDGSSFIVYSLHATNIKNEDVFLTGRYVLDSNNILFANSLRIPADTSLELLRKPQVFKPGDSIQIIGYDSENEISPDSISLYSSYQSLADDRYIRTGITINNQTLNTIFVSDARSSVIESIALNNLTDSVVPATVIVTDQDDVVKGYLTSNLRIPPKASVEVCEYLKTLPINYKIKLQKFASGDLSVFTSSKYNAEYRVDSSTSIINEGETVIFDVVTIGVSPGTTLYYTIEGIQGNVNQNDFITPISGEFSIGDGFASIPVTANLDLNIDIEGDEIFRFYVRTVSTSGTVVGMSQNITIKDTSNISPYSLSENTDLTYSGNSNVSILVSGINNTTTVYYEIEEV